MNDLSRPEDFAFNCPKIGDIEGDGPIRYCGLCNKEVIDLSAVTAEEAESLRRNQAHAPSCMQVTVVDGRPRHRKTSKTLRNVTLALGLGIGGLALAQWSLEPARPSSAQLGGGALNAGGSVLHQTDALHASVNAAIAQAEQLGQPAPEFTPPPPGPPAQPPSAAPTSEVPCDGDKKVTEVTFGGDPPAVDQHIRGKVRPMGGEPMPMPPPK